MSQDTNDGLSEFERAALKERVDEVRKQGRRGPDAAADAAEVEAKIDQMAEPDRSIARRIHELVTATAPDLAPKLWYGQPAYARDGEVVCFFRSGQDDHERYCTFGFTPEARLDEPQGIWPMGYAVTKADAEVEQTLVELLRRALG